MKKIKNLLLLSTLFSLIAFSFSSCVKKDFDEPVTANLDPAGVVATHTIAQLQSKSIGNIPTLVDEEIIISGIIIADDESGNFYKELIIEDSTGGIGFQLDVTNFNTNYPIGRRVFIKCKGLYVANDGDDNYELGFKDGSQIARVPQSLYEKYLIKGMWGFTPTPKVTTIANLVNVKTNTLIQLNNVEFDLAYAGAPFADAINLTSVNADISECVGGETMILRTSGFAKFASELTPIGKGNVIGVYKVFSGDKQISIRTPSDLQMGVVRCNGSSGPSGNESLMPIDSLRMSYPGSATGPVERKIRGTVISDLNTIHTDDQNVIIQDATGGILVRFVTPHSYTRGQVIEVVVTGLPLTEYNELLEVEQVPPLYAKAVGTATETPIVISLADLSADFEKYESSLVELQNVSFSGTGTYNSTTMISDGTISMLLYTGSLATYAGQAYPTTQISKMTGIASQYKSASTIGDGYQIILRNPSYDITP